jgi:hypothetical protein
MTMMAAPGVEEDVVSANIASTAREGAVGTVVQPDRLIMKIIPIAEAPVANRAEPKCQPLRLLTLAAS